MTSGTIVLRDIPRPGLFSFFYLFLYPSSHIHEVDSYFVMPFFYLNILPINSNFTG